MMGFNEAVASSLLQIRLPFARIKRPPKLRQNSWQFITVQNAYSKSPRDFESMQTWSAISFNCGLSPMLGNLTMLEQVLELCPASKLNRRFLAAPISAGFRAPNQVLME
ncbi:hypothetical protein VTK56DRAFT_2836 [Thermocarpiscus australiensis]